jgi:hypothetical protein
VNDPATHVVQDRKHLDVIDRAPSLHSAMGRWRMDLSRSHVLATAGDCGPHEVRLNQFADKLACGTEEMTPPRAENWAGRDHPLGLQPGSLLDDEQT